MKIKVVKVQSKEKCNKKKKEKKIERQREKIEGNCYCCEKLLIYNYKNTHF